MTALIWFPDYTFTGVAVDVLYVAEYRIFITTAHYVLSWRHAPGGDGGGG